MSTETAAQTLDVTGQNCPMPVIETRGAFDDLAAGEVLEVIATDAGSVSDIAGWADSTEGADLIEQAETTEDGEDVYRHYLRKTE